MREREREREISDVRTKLELRASDRMSTPCMGMDLEVVLDEREGKKRKREGSLHERSR